MLMIQISSTLYNPTPAASLLPKGNCFEILFAFSGSHLHMFREYAYIAILQDFFPVSLRNNC